MPLRLDAVTYEARGQRLVDEVSLTLAAGPRSVILGPNGAGKSLLLRLCHGLLRPTSGRIVWSGADPARHQAMAFQRPVLLRRSALANVTYALALRGIARRRRRELALAALERAGLAELARRLADEVLFLHRGRLVERADAARFLDAPQSREATAFLNGELLW